MAGEFSRNAESFGGPKGAKGDSPGQRPGYAAPLRQALKGRHNRCFALSGLGLFLSIEPRALPWAMGASRTLRAAWVCVNKWGLNFVMGKRVEV